MAEDGPGRGLAARFRRAHADQRASRAQEEQDVARRQAEAEGAAKGLVKELSTLARELGFVGVKVAAEALLLTYDGREVVLRLGDVPGELDVLGSGGEQAAFRARIYREHALGAKWVVAFDHRRKEVRLPLFDAGLEEVLVRGLGLPRPGDP